MEILKRTFSDTQKSNGPTRNKLNSVLATHVTKSIDVTIYNPKNLTGLTEALLLYETVMTFHSRYF